MIVWNLFVDFISYALGLTRTESGILLILFLMAEAIRCFYPWEREWKSEKTKDKDGNEVTIHSRIRK